MNKFEIQSIVKNFIENDLSIIDFHTHLFPQDTPFYLDGLNSILNYHYLQAEFLNFSKMNTDDFWSKTETEKASLIWKVLFIDSPPISESTKGVLNILKSLNIPFCSDYLEVKTAFERLTNSPDYFQKVLKLSKVKKVVMTNDIFYQPEVDFFDKIFHPNFLSSIRLDRYFNTTDLTINWNKRNYSLKNDLQRYLNDIVDSLNPIYFALSVSGQFSTSSIEYEFLLKEIFPIAKDKKIPVSLMIGVKRGVNPDYKLAGDGVEVFNISELEKILRSHPDIKFLVTVLSRENQYELCVLSRKFQNLTLFGCWWFLNNPLFIEEITEMRIHLLGTNFIPQHSDARVLEQLIYKWSHTFRKLEPVLVNHLNHISELGYPLSKEKVEEFISDFFNGNVVKLIGASHE